jgi:hypothetical protein
MGAHISILSGAPRSCRGAGNREAGVEEAGAPVSSEGSSMERRRRWVGQKGIEGEREAEGVEDGFWVVDWSAEGI